MRSKMASQESLPSTPIDFLAPLLLATVEGFAAKSSDGNSVSGILYRPANVPANQKLPFILFIHGGPVSQDEYSFDLSHQILASGGYAVAAVNYRGSSGRGLNYTKIISADWGNKEVIDLHGAVDYMIKKGIADPDKLGVAGWSYGGILTDYLIASDTRFKAASSGAGTGFTLSLYGVDQYINQYNNELGPPWKSINTYNPKYHTRYSRPDKNKKRPHFFSAAKKISMCQPQAASKCIRHCEHSASRRSSSSIPGNFTASVYQATSVIVWKDIWRGLIST